MFPKTRGLVAAEIKTDKYAVVIRVINIQVFLEFVTIAFLQLFVYAQVPQWVEMFSV